MYVIFTIGITIVFYQIHSLIKLSNKKNDANRVLGTYKHKSHIGGFYMSLISNVVLYMFPIAQKKFICAFWLSPILVIFILKYYRNSQKVELFDTGIQVFGDFVEWKKIKKLDLIDDEIAFVTSDKDPLYYTVTKLEKSEECYQEMLNLTPHLSST